MEIATCVLLLLVANGMPVLANDILASRWDWPVDGGRPCFIDGRPWLGAAKTWRGLVSAIVAAAIAGWLLGVGWKTGLAVGGLAMAGDLLASFVKRRLAVPVSGRAWLWDQIPEAALPLFFLHEALGVSLAEAALALGLFLVLDLSLSPLLYRLHLRKRPY